VLCNFTFSLVSVQIILFKVFTCSIKYNVVAYFSKLYTYFDNIIRQTSTLFKGLNLGIFYTKLEYSHERITWLYTRFCGNIAEFTAFAKTHVASVG